MSDIYSNIFFIIYALSYSIYSIAKLCVSVFGSRACVLKCLSVLQVVGQCESAFKHVCVTVLGYPELPEATTGQEEKGGRKMEVFLFSSPTPHVHY